MVVPFGLIQRESPEDVRKLSPMRPMRGIPCKRGRKSLRDVRGELWSGKLIVAKESNEVRTQGLFSEHCAIRVIVGD